MRHILILCISLFCLSAKAQTVSGSDLAPLVGVQWNGTLMYVDYSSGNETKIPVRLTVEREDPQTFILHFEYPQEPSANGSSTIAISNDGKTLADQTVLAKQDLFDGAIELVTESVGRDNNRKASFTHTYVIGEETFTMEKHVRYEGESTGFIRNIFEFAPEK